MKVELTSTEIAEKYHVTPRTAFRWKAAHDSRCYVEVDDELAGDRAELLKAQKLRIILDRLSNLNTELAIIGFGGGLSPEMSEGRKKLWRAIDALQRESGVYPASYWEEGEEE